MSEPGNDLARQPGKHRAALLTRSRDAAGEDPSRLRRLPDDGPAPLSYAQESLWFLDRLGGGSTYNVPAAFRLRGALDVPALRAALADVVARHDGLRTGLHEVDGRGVQRVVESAPVELPVVAPVGADPEQRLAGALALAEDAAREAFDLTVAPLWRAQLVRIAEDDHLLLFVVHHAVFDGWSLGVFSRDLTAFYRARTDEPGAAQSLPELSVRYSDYARWQRNWLQGRRLEELAGYWRRQLAGVPVVEFPTDRPRPAQLSFSGRTLRTTLPADRRAAVDALAAAQGTSAYSVYLAAFLIVLHRYTGQEDLTVGAATANRGRAELEPLIGYFISMLALRTDVSGDPSVRELIDRVTAVTREAMAHGELPFDRVVDAVRPPRDPARSPIFSIGFGLQNLAESPTLPGLTIEAQLLELEIARFDMTWSLTELPEGLEILLEYNTALFEKSTMEGVAGQFAQTLQEITADPDQPMSRVRVLTDADMHELLTRWNGAQRPEPTATLTETFEARARHSPDLVAVVAGGVPTTYGQLNARANRLARLLVEHGVGPGTRVALTLLRNVDLITAIVAALKAGASYTPVDPAYPASRISAMLADARPLVWLTHGRLAATLPADGPPKLLLDELDDTLAGYADTDLATGPALDTEAYLLFTSGTTGVPKGVPIQHGMVDGFVRTNVDMYGLTAEDRILCYASLNFDVSVLEIFTALLIGARLCVVSDAERIDMVALQRLIEVEQVSFIDIPPPVMALLTPERFTAAKHVMVGGEIFNGQLVNRWNKGRKLTNGYGPTECTIAMIFHDCAGHWDTSPPIGLPAPNHVAHVVDRHLRPLPYGAAGELVIGGEGLMTGYLNDPELTARKIVPDPFGTAPGGRLYHTGDLARRLRDGTLICLGRVDAQVKIRGQRIELGEVESVLATHPAVTQVAVQPWTDGAGDKHLAAYVSVADGAAPEIAALRRHVARQLPRHMVPAYVVVLPELPLTVSGKVDTRALPPPQESARIGSGGEPPTTETERVLATDLVAKLLGVSRVGIHDNFFELGGNSLQATQLTSRIRDRYHVEIALSDFFQSPTVAHLAGVIDRSRAAELTDEELLELLAQMPEEEASRLLDKHVGPDLEAQS